jgi:hypothetical protein
MKRVRKLISTTFVVAAIGCTSLLAQEVQTMKAYISMNTADGFRVHELSDDVLGIEYTDAYGKLPNIALKIYDWKQNAIATLNLDKSFGLNSYSIAIKDIYAGWEMNQIYLFELQDEKGKKYELPVKLIPKPDKPGPQVGIIVDPEQVGCDDLSFNLVRFYGDIKGGQPPYTVTWYIVNEHRTDFLYQPREEIIASAGKTMVVTVDKNPDYYVLLYVKDSCGKVEKSIVNLVCEDNKKKINTIFVEELNAPLLKSRIKQITP